MILFFNDFGEITASMTSSDETFILNENSIIGVGNNQTHYVKNNQLLEYTEEQKLRKSQRPSFIHEWSNETFEWIDPRTKKQKKADLESLISSLQNQIDTISIDIFASRTSPLQSIYDMKEVQAKSWIDSEFKDPIPSFIEAEAFSTGVKAETLAKTIVQKAIASRAENQEILPKIESSRRKWKTALPNAKDEQSAREIYQAAISELETFRK